MQFIHNSFTLLREGEPYGDLLAWYFSEDELLLLLCFLAGGDGEGDGDGEDDITGDSTARPVL